MRLRRSYADVEVTHEYEGVDIYAFSSARLVSLVGLAAAAAIILSGCTDSPQEVMATATCPTPLHRVLVATQTSTPGSNDVVGASTPSPSIDPVEQLSITATATFSPDSDNSA